MQSIRCFVVDRAGRSLFLRLLVADLEGIPGNDSHTAANEGFAAAIHQLLFDFLVGALVHHQYSICRRFDEIHFDPARLPEMCPAQFATCRYLVGACMGALYLVAENNSSIFSHLPGQCGGYTDTVRRRSLAFEIAWTLICPLDLNEGRP